MKAIHHFALKKAGTTALTAGLLLLLTLIPSRGSFQAQGYTTPAYIDFELGEYVATREKSEISVVVHRTGDFRQVSTVDFRTVEGTATEGRDYKGTGGTLVFQPLESFKTINLTILRAGALEEDEFFMLELSSQDPSVFLVRETALVIIEGAAAAPPALKIRPGGDGTIVLSWAASGDWTLERASSLNTSDWAPAAVQPELVDGQFEVRETVTSPVFLYRLRQR